MQLEIHRSTCNAAQLLNLESIAVSYEDIAKIIQLLLSLRQRIQDHDREINHLRERVNEPTGNQRQEPEIFHKSKNPWVL